MHAKGEEMNTLSFLISHEIKGKSLSKQLEDVLKSILRSIETKTINY